jgi:TRAP-type C4-dicarboxylate transport system permease large subunit
VTPFFIIMMLGIALVIAFPQLAVWLPNTMRSQ